MNNKLILFSLLLLFTSNLQAGIGVGYSNKVTSVFDMKFDLPNEYSLSQNYPNPFNPSTTISYSIPFTNSNENVTQKVRINIFDILGNEVSAIVNKEQSSGNYKVNFSANNLSNGIYFYKLQVGNFIAIKKMILLK